MNFVLLINWNVQAFDHVCANSVACYKENILRALRRFEDTSVDSDPTTRTVHIFKRSRSKKPFFQNEISLLLCSSFLLVASQLWSEFKELL